MSLAGRVWQCLTSAEINSLSDSFTQEKVVNAFRTLMLCEIPYQIIKIKIFSPSNMNMETVIRRAEKFGFVAVRMHGYIQADPIIRLNQLYAWLQMQNVTKDTTQTQHRITSRSIERWPW